MLWNRLAVRGVAHVLRPIHLQRQTMSRNNDMLARYLMAALLGVLLNIHVAAFSQEVASEEAKPDETPANTDAGATSEAASSDPAQAAETRHSLAKSHAKSAHSTTPSSNRRPVNRRRNRCSYYCPCSRFRTASGCQR